MRTRLTKIDNLKGFCLICIIFGHLLEPQIGMSRLFAGWYEILYLFHIPMFAVLSGYVSKAHKASSDYAKDISRIVFPYLVFEVLFSVLDALISQRSLRFTFLTPNWINWYLMSLLLWRALLPYFDKLKFNLTLSFILALAVGSTDEFNHFLSLSRSFVFLPWFLLGYCLSRNTRYLSTKISLSTKLLSICIGCIFITTFLRFYDFEISFLYGSSSYRNVGLSFFQGVGLRGVLMAGGFLIMTILVLLMPARRVSLLTYVGERSLYAYLLHGVVLKIVRSYHFKVSPDWLGLFQLLGVSILLAAILASPSVTWFLRKGFLLLGLLLSKENRFPKGSSHQRGTPPGAKPPTEAPQSIAA